jgi:carbamoylphosphate synthase large subunit
MEQLKGKRLLLLGGSLWKNSIRSFADKHGIVLLATGNNRHAGIFEIADECYDVDSTDDEKMRELIRSQRVDGVYMGGSEAVISAAVRYLNDLGMPCYCTERQWHAIQNKINFKRLCMEHGLPVAKQYVASLEDIVAETADIQFPVITKPSDGSGSSGFSICNDFAELKTGYVKAGDASPTGSVIVERLVNNDSIVVFYTFSDGEIHFSGIEDKYPVRYEAQGSYVAGMHVFESNRKDEFRRRYEDRIRAMYNSLQIREGSVWMEVFCDDDGFYFNEAGYRYSGSVSIHPVDYFYQINQVAADMHFALTGESRLKGLGSTFADSIPTKKYYCIYSIHLLPGHISKIEGIESVLAMPHVVVVPTTKSVGDEVKPTGTVAQVFAFVHFVFDSLEECMRVIDGIHDTLRIIDTKGKNMVARKLDLSSSRLRHSISTEGMSTCGKQPTNSYATDFERGR